PAAEQAGLKTREITATIRSGFRAGAQRPKAINSRRDINMQSTQKSKTTSGGKAPSATSATQGKTSKSTSGKRAAQNSAGKRGAKQSQSSGNAGGASSQAQAQAGAQTQAPNTAQAGAQASIAGIYQATVNGLIRWTADKHGNRIRVPLTNFNAEIVADIIED